MADLSERVKAVMETDCAHTLEDLVAKPSAPEIRELIAVVEGDAGATANQRQRAVYMLGRMGRTEAAPTIVKALPKLDEGGRIAAADALGRLATPEAQAKVVELSLDAAPQVRKFAAKALARIGTQATIGHLRGMVDGDEESFVRATAGKVLSRMEDGRQ